MIAENSLGHKGARVCDTKQIIKIQDGKKENE